MQKISIEKWVDELQAQIDQVKREVQSIPAPAASSVVICGAAAMTVTDTSGENDTFTRAATCSIAGAFDSSAFEYHIGYDFVSYDTDVTYIGSKCSQKALTAAIPDGDALLIDKVAIESETETITADALLNAIVTVSSSKIDVTIESNYGDGKGIAPDTGHTRLSYSIYAAPKPATRTKKKK